MRYSLEHLWAFLSGCSHKHTTWPRLRTSKLKRGQSRCYVMCLDCGKEMDHWLFHKEPQRAKARTRKAKEVRCLEKLWRKR